MQQQLLKGQRSENKGWNLTNYYLILFRWIIHISRPWIITNTASCYYSFLTAPLTLQDHGCEGSTVSSKPVYAPPIADTNRAHPQWVAV